jgi:hypothetical protein
MTKDDQEVFIKDVLKSFNEGILEKVPHLPETWDGFEIREYMLSFFKQHWVWTSMKGRRLRSFRNELIVNSKL